ncbi:GerMN domain-containing protein [Alkalihalobacillus sp. MEB130]|uniref:GerMN domain-containing protein n=1 Tax=Alkalihalobacillus sp. MEB130 TaxID=2976704 RepID=UPI0028DEE66C|nr:GerMN domain-containing protein [Alkalihalobacillus sp. MEB130]MDT8859589.1 GerMN domain-containing protein [Alkalihalobacillus sp. MEB130]
MKKIGMFLTLALFILFLGACGQGTASNSGEEPTLDEVETDESSELIEEEEEITEEIVEVVEEIEVEPDTVANETEDAASNDEEVVNETTVTPIELIFSDDMVEDMYRVERQLEVSDDELFKATLGAWISGPTEEGLVSLLPNGVQVLSVEEIEEVAHVSFSSELLEANVGAGTEYMLVQQIAMAMKQFGFNETQILVDGEIHPELFGHIDTSVPIVAENPEDYEKVN